MCSLRLLFLTYCLLFTMNGIYTRNLNEIFVVFMLPSDDLICLWSSDREGLVEVIRLPVARDVF